MNDTTSIMVREMHMSYDLKLSCVELLIVDDFESQCTRLLKARLDNMKAFLNSGKADENRSSSSSPARIRRRVFGNEFRIFCSYYDRHLLKWRPIIRNPDGWKLKLAYTSEQSREIHVEPKSNDVIQLRRKAFICNLAQR